MHKAKILCYIPFTKRLKVCVKNSAKSTLVISKFKVVKTKIFLPMQVILFVILVSFYRAHHKSKKWSTCLATYFWYVWLFCLIWQVSQGEAWQHFIWREKICCMYGKKRFKQNILLLSLFPPEFLLQQDVQVLETVSSPANRSTWESR